MVIQHIVVFTIWAIVFVNGDDSNYTNVTTNEANKTGKYDSGASATVVVNTVACFSGDSQVQLINGTWKTIGQLQPGDFVYGYHGSKIVRAEMIMMLDQQSSIDIVFHTLKTESGHNVSLTSLHLIPVVSSSEKLIYKPAKDVQIDDRLFILSNSNISSSPIIEITIDVKKGYYTPLTDKGVLFVNGILSSCFANVQSHDDAQFYMTPLNWYYQTARLLSINDPFGTSSTDGVHWIPKLMFAFGQQFRPSTLLV